MPDEPSALKSAVPMLIAAEPPREEDLSLADILRFLSDYRRHIAAVTLACTLIAALYAFIRPPSYAAMARLSLPSPAAVRILADIRTDSTPQWVFRQFLNNLDSQSLRRRYFDEQAVLKALVDADRLAEGTVNEQQVFTRDFDQRLGYVRSDPSWQGQTRGQKSLPEQVQVTLEGRVPAQLAEWLNGFIALANQRTVAAIREELQSELAYKIQTIEDSIEALRTLNRQQRLDQIVRLQEEDSIKRDDILNQKQALKAQMQQEWQDEKMRLTENYNIARALNILKPSFLDARQLEDTPVALANFQNLPTYARGAEALGAQIESLDERMAAESDAFVDGLRELEQALALLESNPTIEALNARQSDDAHIDGLRELERQLEGLQTLSVRLAEDQGLTAAMIDQPAYPPYERLAPRRSLIVAIGLTVGLFSGILLALVLRVQRAEDGS